MKARRSARAARSRPKFGAELERRGRIGLAVFSSEGCGLCKALEPAIDAFGNHPAIVLRTFDEHRARRRVGGGRRARQPVRGRAGPDGTVLAKGTFNTGAQLESVLAAAERRRGAVRA